MPIDARVSMYENDSDNWKKQLQNAVRTLSQLAVHLDLTEQEIRGIKRLFGRSCNANPRIPLLVSPYYLSLCERTNPNCPIRMQCIPRDSEAFVNERDLVDPLGEQVHEVAPHLVKRYPDRAMLLVTSTCATHCRFCTRGRMVGAQNGYCSLESLEPALLWLQQNPQIRELLLSGGDPLVASDSTIDRLLTRIRKIRSIEVIRIGTRVPAVLPMRIDDRLVQVIRRHHPVWLMSHFNHPKELTPYAKKALQILVDGGIPVMNQTVMLQGINDDEQLLMALFTGLVANRVRPYYLLHGDAKQGTSHFRTSVSKSIEIFGRLQGRLSGIALPKLIVDVPGGEGKVPIGPQTIVKMEHGKTELMTYTGKIVTVYDP